MLGCVRVCCVCVFVCFHAHIYIFQPIIRERVCVLCAVCCVLCTVCCVLCAVCCSRRLRSFAPLSGYRTRTMLCVPVRARGGHIVAVVQAINKICPSCESMCCDRHGVEFDHEDVLLLDAVSVEVSSALQRQQLEMAFSKVMEDQGVHTGVRAYLNQFNGSTGATGQTEEDDRMDEAAAAAAAATAAVAATAKATGASLVFDGC
jgi:hypothetical protein